MTMFTLQLSAKNERFSWRGSRLYPETKFDNFSDIVSRKYGVAPINLILFGIWAVIPG